MPSHKVEADRPPKRMRLGTKSCAECRRRKVRCIYAPDSRVCKECILHDAVCLAQTAKAAQQLGHLTPESSGDDHSMRSRLEELEGMVRTLCKAVDIKVDQSNPGRLEIDADALNRLRQASSPDQTSESSFRGTLSLDTSEFGSPNGVPRSTESFEDAPLLRLFKAAMLIEGNGAHEDPSRATLTTHRQRACITSLNSLMPSFEDLTSILQTTQVYWPVWHAFPHDLLPSHDTSPSDALVRVRKFIIDSMRSNDPCAVAKAILCLALCVQQLPVQFQDQAHNLPATPSALLDSYLMGAESLIPVNDSAAGTIDDLECFILQAKLYVNMARPRNAWLCFRRAINSAILQGFHNLGASLDERRVGIWNYLIVYDRNFSLILGLPYSIPDSHPGVGLIHNGSSQTPELQAMYINFATITGYVIDRNQTLPRPDYSVTERIERKLIEFETGPGAVILNTVVSPGMPLDFIYESQVAKLFYHNLWKHTHLPYMLKSSIDGKYEHSRLAALHAAREMIYAWLRLRECSGSAKIICDLMDFQVFTAAIVLMLNLLSPSCLDPMHQQTSDWERIHEVTRELGSISTDLDCKVSGQAATLLEYLSAAHWGVYEGPEVYEAVMPYFGRVRICQLMKPEPPTDIKNEGWQGQEAYGNTIDFSMDSFVSFSQNYMGDYLTDAELGVDWTAVLNADIGYEWSQSFHSANSGIGIAM